MWPVAVIALNGTSVGTRTWRRRGQMYVTVVVKATFGIIMDAPMRQLAPDALRVDEVPDPEGHGLLSGGDMAPYLGDTDFWMVGHARGSVSIEDGTLSVHVGIVRDGMLIYEKRLALTADSGGKSPRTFHLGGWGPLSRHWPVRSRFLGPHGGSLFNGAFVDVPDDFDLGYFQTSPLDQRLSPLRGDEWIFLQNIFSENNCWRVRLPGCMGVAKVFGQSGALAQGHVIRMGLDSLQIDTDRRITSLLWRG